jgi:acetyltransferase-like isoleucine patch superfamily enzyme
MFAKFTQHYATLTIPDFFRKLIYKFKNTFSIRLFRRLKSLFYFKNISVGLGKNIVIHGLPFKVRVGDQTLIYDHCIFEFDNSSDISIGSNVVFSYGVLLSCRMKIHIGNDVQVGEYSSIRDSTHRYDKFDMPMKYAGDISKPVIIEDDVWIGRGCLISPGAYIESGVVVAANSVVKGRLLRNGIYGGVPARLIKYRKEFNSKLQFNT